MQNFDESKWVQEKFGWQSEHDKSAVQKNLKNITNATKFAEKAFEKSAAMEPHIAAAKKAKDIAQKGIETIKGNITQSKENEKKDRLTGRDASKTPFHIYLLCGIIFSVCFWCGGIIFPLFTTAVYFSSPALSTPAVLTQVAYDTKIVEVAKNELAVSKENIGGLKYKNWYGINDKWCAMFVSYCANECGYLEKGIMPKSASVMNMSNWYKEHGRWKDASDYTPKPGDIIFFQNDMSHVGIVIDYNASTRIITTIEGNTGFVDTSVEHVHDWQVAICNLCGGDHLTAEEQICVTCKGKGYILSKSGTANVYNDCSSIMKYTGCGSCGGSGTLTEYYNKYGCAWIEGNIVYGAGRTGESLLCMACYNLPDLFGKVTWCANEDCVYSSYGAWSDYPDGTCYTTIIEHHEGSAVLEQRYPITYAKISGYGLPEYPLVKKANSEN